MSFVCVSRRLSFNYEVPDAVEDDHQTPIAAVHSSRYIELQQSMNTYTKEGDLHVPLYFRRVTFHGDKGEQ